MGTAQDQIKPSTPPAWLLLVVLVFSAWAAVFVYRASFVVDDQRYFCLFDDEMISMRYARNLATGHGLVWNPGGERVEGFTNPLWTFVMAGVHWIGISDAKASLAIQILAAVLLVLNLVLTNRLAGRLGTGSPLVSMTAVMLTASYYPLNNWGLQGAEVALLAPIVTGAALLLAQGIRNGRISLGMYAILCIALLTRADAVVLYAAAWSGAAWFDRTHRRAHVLWGLGALLSTMAAQVLARYAYYGEWLPNTYYLKLTGFPLYLRITRGLDVFWSFVSQANWLIVAATVFLALRTLGRPGRAVLWILLWQSLYSVYVGGDAWEAWGGSNRYLSIIMPIFFALFAVSAASVARWVLEADWRSVTMAGRVRIGCAFLLAALVCLLRFPHAHYWNQTLNNTDATLVVHGILAVATLLISILILRTWFSWIPAPLRIMTTIAIALSMGIGWTEQGWLPLGAALLLTALAGVVLRLMHGHGHLIKFYVILAGLHSFLSVYGIDLLGFCLAAGVALACFDETRRRQHVIGTLAVVGTKMLVSWTLFPPDLSALAHLGASGLLHLVADPFLGLLAGGIDLVLRLNAIVLLPVLALPIVMTDKPTLTLWLLATSQLLWAAYRGSAGVFSWVGGGHLSFVVVPLFWIVSAVAAARLVSLLRWAVLTQPRVTPRVCRLAVGGAILCAVFNFNGYFGLDSVWNLAFFHEPQLVTYNQDNVQLARTLVGVCRKEATVAVTWAGSVPYFSDLRCIDLLGKCDRVIARLPMHQDEETSAVSFTPGHMKWDLAYSIGQLKPDVVAQFWAEDRSQTDMLTTDYILLNARGRQVFARRGSPHVRWEAASPLTETDSGI